MVLLAGIAMVTAGCWTNRGTPPDAATATPVGVNESGTILVQGDREVNDGGIHREGWLLSAEDQWIPLGTLDPDAAVQPIGINSEGTVVGNSIDYGVTPATTTPFMWSQETGLEALSDVLGEAHDDVAGISDSGHLVGNDVAQSFSNQPWIWDPDTGASIGLATPSGYSGARATGVNAQGWVIGQSSWGPVVSAPTVWTTPAYSPVTLPIADADSATVTDIDDDGTMVGYLWYDNGVMRSRAVVWDHADGHMLRYLDEDPDPTKVQFASEAVAIDDGVVIGREEGCTPETPICGGIWWEVAWNAETLERVALYGDGITNNHPWFTALDGPHLVGANDFGEVGARQVVSRTTPEV